MVTVGQDVFVVLFLCAGGEAGPGSARNIWSTQRPLALHPSQDPTRLLPLARARSLLGGGVYWPVWAPAKENRMSAHRLLMWYDQLWVHTHMHTHTPPLPMLLTYTFSASCLECPASPGASCLRNVDQSAVTMQSTFAVKGLKMEAQPKATHSRPSKSRPAKPTNCQQPRRPRIRNYNLKD